MSIASGLFTANEFANRGVIKLAPDVLVYIGGSLQGAIIAPVAGKDSNINFNDGISSVSVQANLDPPGSSTATIEVLAPVYNERSNYWIPFKSADGTIQRHPVFVPMSEVKIYMKGRFMVQDSPRYYPVFWGFITTVEENYSGGVHKITLQCADILHWWGLTSITTHPVPESKIAAGSGPGLRPQTMTAYSSIFKAANPFVIIKRLFSDLGMDQFVAPTWVAQLQPPGGVYPKGAMQLQATGIMQYWDTRFKNLSSLLKMYGLKGEQYDVALAPGAAGGKTFTVRAIKTRHTEFADVGKSAAKGATAQQPVDHIDYDDKFIKRFTVFFDYTQMGTFEQAETMTKLDIAQAIKTKIDFEFFQDTNGEFIFKPPFYNMNVKGLQPYEIEPHDIMSNSFSQDSDGIITVLEVQGSMHMQLKNITRPKRPGFHMDPDLVARYGVRYRSMDMSYITDSSIMRALTVAQMNLINAQAFTGSLSIPLRPELRLGYPVYVRHRDSFHYVRSINHSFDYGGSASTSLSLFTERRLQYRVDEKGNFTNDILKDYSYKFKSSLPPIVRKQQKNAPKITDKDPEDQLAEKVTVGEVGVTDMKTGLYDLVELPSDNDRDLAVISVQRETIPFSDSQGYRVVGAFPYGRGLSARIVDQDNVVMYTADAQLQDVTNIKAGSQMESDRMKGVQFAQKGEEGAVPMYLEGSRIDLYEQATSAAPVSSAQATTTQANQVPTQPVRRTGKPKSTKGQATAVTNMTPNGSGGTSAATAPPAQPLVGVDKWAAQGGFGGGSDTNI